MGEQTTTNDPGRTSEWYNLKQVYEMVQSLKDQMRDLCAEMQRTRDLIAEYNGLRQRLEVCERSLQEEQGKDKGKNDLLGWIVGIGGLLVAALALFLK